MIKYFVMIAAALGGLAACNAEPAASAGAPAAALAQSPAGLPVVPLDVRSNKGRHRFSVEVAGTEAEQARGLMYRPSLAPDAGMIFPFSEVRPATFWMKNTMIPLDIIFIRDDGSIARIAANAAPYSLDIIPSGEPVAAVLEIAGGRAAQLGIESGDHVSWPGGPPPSR